MSADGGNPVVTACVILPLPLAGLVAVVGTRLGLLDEFITATRPVAVTAILATVVLVARAKLGSGGRSATAHVYGGRRKTVIKHEALGHAAVAGGVGASNIRARLKPGGGGEVTCDTSRMSPAEYVAFMRAGKAVAGASGDCLDDEAAAKEELRYVPADQQAAVEREANRIVRRHVGNAFGRKVARALEQTGRFR